MRNLISLTRRHDMVRINEGVDEYYNSFPLSDYFSFDIHPCTSIVRFDSDYAMHLLCNSASEL